MTCYEIINKVLPCMQNYFQGDYSFKTKECFKNNKCEFLNGMWKFIYDIYPEYNIVRCCDIERQDIAQPEALLLNSNNEYIALEMKCIPNNLMNTVQETEKRDKKDFHFWEKIIDDCGKQSYEKLYKKLFDLYNSQGIDTDSLDELLQIIFDGLLVKLCSKSKDKCIQQIFMDKKQEIKNKSILIEEMCNFSYQIFIDLVNGKTPNVLSKIDKDEYSIILCLTHNNTVSFEIHDKNYTTLSSLIDINEKGLCDFLNKFLISCEKKFSNISNTKKNILILDHNFISYKSLNIIESCLKKCEIPKCISEIWVCDKLIESEYNEDGEEVGDYIADINYKKLYEVSQSVRD